MEMKQLNDTMQRPSRYWNIDGLPEVGIGVVWVLTSALCLLPVYIPERWRAFPAVAMMIVIPLATMMLGRMVKSLKRRTTAPRTGYVEPRKPSGRTRLLAGAVGLAIAAGMAFLVTARGASNFELYMTPLLGLITGGAFFVMGIKQGEPRLCGVGVFSGVLGILVALPGWSVELTLGSYFGILGLALLISGSRRLRSFLRENPVAAREGI